MTATTAQGDAPTIEFRALVDATTLFPRLALVYDVPQSRHRGRHYVGHLGRFAIPAAAITGKVC